MKELRPWVFIIFGILFSCLYFIKIQGVYFSLIHVLILLACFFLSHLIWGDQEGSWSWEERGDLMLWSDLSLYFFIWTKFVVFWAWESFVFRQTSGVVLETEQLSSLWEQLRTYYMRESVYVPWLEEI